MARERSVEYGECTIADDILLSNMEKLPFRRGVFLF